jgi:GTP-binding protein Era
MRELTVSEHKAGFVAIVGRPNVGKSTLVNALVGKKIVITSKHPNTTRNPIRGIITRSDYQIIVVDTPGIHKPKTILGARLNEMVAENVEDVDAAVVCLPANEPLGAGDEFVVNQVKKSPIIVALTKCDSVGKSEIIEKLAEINKMFEKIGIKYEELIPISAKNNEQVDVVESEIAKRLQDSPALYPADMDTDQASELLISEFIRESAIADTFQEVPHSIVVTIEEMKKREGRKLVDIHATIHVERDSQKPMLIGKQGSKLKEIGSRARAQIENYLESKVFLSLHVKVTKDWQKDPKALAKLGFIES